MSWKSLRGAAQRAQPTGGRSPSVEPLDSCLCQGYPTPTTTPAHCSSASTSPPSKCRLATWSVRTDGLVPNFESHAQCTSSSRRANPRAWANCFHILRRRQTQVRTVTQLRSAWGFHPPVCAAPGLPGRGASSSLFLSNIFFQLLFGVVLWRTTRLFFKLISGFFLFLS